MRDPTPNSWQLEYSERLLAHAGVSFAYLNEGHLSGHHCDGVAPQARLIEPLGQDRLEIALGAGPYLYFDTTTAGETAQGSGLGFRNDHGLGAMVTAALTYRVRPRWFARLSVSAVRVPDGFDSQTLVLGFGYRGGALLARSGGAGGRFGADGGGGRNELGAFLGETIVNSPSSPDSATFGVEYRRRVARHFDLSGAWLSEESGPNGRHDGIVGQVWLVQRFLGGQASVGIGVGPYLALESYRTDDGRPGAALAGIASMTVAWQIVPSIAARLMWRRGFTQDDQDRDRDIITAGLAWTWGR